VASWWPFYLGRRREKAPFDQGGFQWGLEKFYYKKRIRFFLYVRLSFLRKLATF
jgi:hypothetical protein